MDFISCSSGLRISSSEDDEESSSPPTFLPSSCSELSSDPSSQDDNIDGHLHLLKLKAGQASPRICRPRKFSTAIATSPQANHPALAGRTTVILPIPPLPSTPELRKYNSTPPKMAVHPSSTQSQPPRAPRSGPSSSKRTSDYLEERSVTFNAGTLPQLDCSSPTSSDLPKPRRLHRASSAPVKDKYARARMDPAPLRLEAWSEPAAENFDVRGRMYTSDRLKEPSAASMFRLLTVDLVRSEKPLYGGLCSHPSERIQQALKREREMKKKQLPPFIVAVNLCIPGSGDITYHQVTYFAVDDFNEIKHPSTPHGRLMNRFIFGSSDDYRDQTFKLIPRIVEGNYIVRTAVGSKPTILGKKIKQYYVLGERYFEIIVDIGSEPVAQRITKLALGYAKSLVTDMMFLVEGTDEETLPERIFGGVRLKNVDFRDKDGWRTVKP